MNTQISLWLEPLVMDNRRCNGKVFFDCIIEGNHSKLEPKELEDVIGDKTIRDIMDYANIPSNFDYGVVSSKATKKAPAIKIVPSPEKVANDKKEATEKKAFDKKLLKVISSKKELEITKRNVEILDNGKLQVSFPDLKVNDTIDFPKIWNTLEKNFIGKIKEGETVTLTDDFGNKIFEIRGGSFLNVALADLSVYDKKKKAEHHSIFNHGQGLKGGLFVREDGSLDIGDFKRTFFLNIYTNNLIKASLKLGKSMNELTQTKLLEQQKPKEDDTKQEN